MVENGYKHIQMLDGELIYTTSCYGRGKTVQYKQIQMLDGELIYTTSCYG